MMTEEQIYKEYLEQQEIYYNIIDNVPLGLSYEDFAKENLKLDISISPTDVLDKNYRTDHDYVVWYNR